VPAFVRRLLKKPVFAGGRPEIVSPGDTIIPGENPN